jgi:hypothetical protein
MAQSMEIIESDEAGDSDRLELRAQHEARAWSGAFDSGCRPGAVHPSTAARHCSEWEFGIPRGQADVRLYVSLKDMNCPYLKRDVCRTYISSEPTAGV